MFQSQSTNPNIEERRDEVAGVEVRVGEEVSWSEWREWLRPLLDDGLLRPFGVDLPRTKRVQVLSLTGALPRLSGMLEPDRARLHYVIACEMERGFVLCLPLTLTRRVDYSRVLLGLGADEAAQPINAWSPDIWSETFEVIPHFTMAEFVKHCRLTFEERRSLRRLLEQQLPEKIFARISFALEWRN